MFMEFLASVCSELKDQNIDIAIQTCGHFNFERFETTISPCISTVFFDLKIADESLHIEQTRQGNKVILENLSKLFSPKRHKIIIRTPLIPGITDTPDNLSRIQDIVSRYDHDGFVQLMFNDSYHKKLRALGRIF